MRPLWVRAGVVSLAAVAVLNAVGCAATGKPRALHDPVVIATQPGTELVAYDTNEGLCVEHRFADGGGGAACGFQPTSDRPIGLSVDGRWLVGVVIAEATGVRVEMREGGTLRPRLIRYEAFDEAVFVLPADGAAAETIVAFIATKEIGRTQVP